MLLLQIPNLILQSYTPLLIFIFFHWINLFDMLNLLFLDLMHFIDFKKQCGVYPMIAEVPMEKDTSLLYGSTYPLLKGIR